ncbi:rubrerythrin family protein [Thermodesulfobacteriota bacterium]
MTDKIQKNIAKAFSEQSRASSRNQVFAQKADKDGLSKLAVLFRAIANAESVHSKRFLLLMRGKSGTSEENIKSALQAEISATEKYYPGMIEDAKNASKAVRKAFTQAMATDSKHAELLRSALKDMLTNTNHRYYVCQICGNINKDIIPENCPVCMAVPGRFKEVV